MSKWLLMYLPFTLLFGLTAGAFSVFVPASTYIQFAVWLLLLVILSLTVFERLKSVGKTCIFASIYSTVYIVTHGLLETNIRHNAETLQGWILMLCVYNALSVVAIWWFLRKIKAWTKNADK